MSFCKSTAQLSVVRNVGFRKASVNQKRRLFSLWSRVESDGLKAELLALLGYEWKGSCYSTFSAIPEIEPEVSARYLNYRQASALFSKDEDMLSPIDKRGAALDSFRVAEETCKSVNDAIRGGGFAKGEAALILYYAQQKISSILGEAPNIDELDLSFGAGASTSCTKEKTSARWKLSSPPSISRSAVTDLQSLIRTLPSYFLHHKKVQVHDGKLDFVPKNYKTMRSICVEPTVNTMVQRGIGQLLKRKLKVAGVDLFDQSINRRRAKQGSITGNLATIDLEKASDSIAYLLVMELLPWDWFHLLDTYRSSHVRYDGSLFHLEKFSSMGNGYTFELESLIFYSLAWGLSKLYHLPFDVTVYGDDIVANRNLATRIFEWFPTFGFSVNLQKSFKDGPFRESCGGDFVTGVDVRPFYLKDRFSYFRVICFYNFLVRKPQFDRCGSLRRVLIGWLPEKFRLWGPDGYGDGHLISDLPHHLKPYGREHGYSGYTFNTFVSRVSRNTEECYGDPLLPSYSASLLTERRSYLLGTLDSSSKDPYQVRTLSLSTSREKKVRIYVLGPIGL